MDPKTISNIIGNVCVVLSLSSILVLNGCAGWLPASGPTTSEIKESTSSRRMSGIQIVDLSDAVARKLVSSRKLSLFSETLGMGAPSAYLVGPGDVVEVSVWEAPPATLFGSSSIETRGTPAGSRPTSFPEQMVNREGYIMIPFAGMVRAAGRTPEQIAKDVSDRLKGMANQPQSLVRVLRNSSANVTVVGEVATSARIPLTPKGERLLDALAASGGVRQPVNKMTLQVTRGSQVQALPLETIIRDPGQNIVLQPGDVVTALFQPMSFTILGATGKNEEINFEAQGISLTQALARAGGLQDARADAQGVFIFRLEAANALDWPVKPLLTTPDGKVPVIYRIDLKDPGTFFVAQSFQVQNSDLLYVANAPSVELQKFLNILFTAAYPVITGIQLTR